MKAYLSWAYFVLPRGVWCNLSVLLFLGSMYGGNIPTFGVIPSYLSISLPSFLPSPFSRHPFPTLLFSSLSWYFFFLFCYSSPLTAKRGSSQWRKCHFLIFWYCLGPFEYHSAAWRETVSTDVDCSDSTVVGDVVKGFCLLFAALWVEPRFPVRSAGAVKG